MSFIKFNVGDIVEVKKKHPCGASRFIVMRTGSDVRMVCRGCGRDITVDRLKAEKFIKKVLGKEENENA